MLATYPHACAHKHICGTVADTSACNHNGYTCEGALHQLGRGVTLPKRCNTTN